MANFTPSKKTAQDFNNGIEYVDGQGNEMGDAIQAETVNNLIESQMWVQKLAETDINNSAIANEGTPKIGIEIEPTTGFPRFYAENLVGKSQITYCKTLTFGSITAPLTRLPDEYNNFFIGDFSPSSFAAGVKEGKTFLVNEEIYLPTGTAARGGVKHTYLTVYQISMVNVNEGTISANVVSRVETTGNGIEDIKAVGTETTDTETKTTVEVSFTDSHPQSFEVVAKNGTMFEIPYDLTQLQSNSEGVDFIINNIGAIKKGAYFNSNNTIVFLSQLNTYEHAIEILFDHGSTWSNDSVDKYCIYIDITTKAVTVSIDKQYKGDYTDWPQLLIGRRKNNIIEETTSGVFASPENDGKIVGMKNGKFVAMDQAAKIVLDNIYPIGSIFMSCENVSPASFWGGSWTSLTNRFLIGASSSYPVNSTGGEATHRLTTNEMPSHNHTAGSHSHTINAWIMEQGIRHKDGTDYIPQRGDQGYASGKFVTSSATPSINLTGGGQAHNNMPPYLAVYMWKRIA